MAEQTNQAAGRKNPEESCSNVATKSPGDNESFLANVKREIKKPLVWIEILALLVLSAYTYFAYKQSNAMLESNRISRDALTSVQRAFVTAQAIQATALLQGQTIFGWRFLIPWENNGTTPTRNARTYSGWTNTLPDNSTFLRSKTANTTPLVLGPKDSLTSVPMDFPIDLAIQAARGNPRPLIYFYGWIRYNDVFESTNPHLTEVCRALTQVVGDPNSPKAITQWVYTLCPTHNCEDKECEDYAAMSQNPGR